jgi:hypothetical protein
MEGKADRRSARWFAWEKRRKEEEALMEGWEVDA